MSSFRRCLLAVWCVLCLYGLAAAGRIYSRKYYIWLPEYLRWSMNSTEPQAGTTHVFLVVADHFEPGNYRHRMIRWERDYPALASRHRDSTGRPVQHTWFYPGEQPNDANMLALRNLVGAGYGEVELHCHHNHDSLESARARFQEAIAYFQRFGFLKTTGGQTRFAFVHGNWSLDNSEGVGACGANRELSLLRELGCFADFTFPAAWKRAQPRWVNSIRMASDDGRDKSYDDAAPLQVGGRSPGDLMMFQGPLVIYPAWDPAHLFWRVEDGNVHPAVPLTAERVDLWIRAGIHIAGKPDWVFVKIHSHGASTDQDVDELLGRHFDGALSYLERKYNNGRRYALHYITAREAYNLACAAAAGRSGPPEQYYNWVVKPYLAGAREASLLASSQ
ncbi:MAG: hypothetical protein ACM336_16895 [Acidobacteriota bacterium]